MFDILLNKNNDRRKLLWIFGCCVVEDNDLKKIFIKMFTYHKISVANAKKQALSIFYNRRKSYKKCVYTTTNTFCFLVETKKCLTLPLLCLVNKELFFFQNVYCIDIDRSRFLLFTIINS